jgi:DNA polymerase V
LTNGTNVPYSQILLSALNTDNTMAVRILQTPPHDPGAPLPDLPTTTEQLPLFGHKAASGFPSPADDYVEDRLDLNRLLVHNKSATFFLRVRSDSMVNAGIFDGDIIVVDRAVEPADRSVVVAVVDGELTVKRLRLRNGSAELHAENPKYPPIRFREGQELTIWGVVTSAVHAVR